MYSSYGQKIFITLVSVTTLRIPFLFMEVEKSDS